MLKPLALLVAASVVGASPTKYELLTYESAADPKAMVVAGGNARFTVLSSRLLRMEYKGSEGFEDRATLAFVNRKQPVPKYTWDAKTGVLKTEHLVLTYKGGAFSEASLTVDAAPGSPTSFKHWHFGMDSSGDSGNLRGTQRTLDRTANVSLACDFSAAARKANFGVDHCQLGVVSRSGWALVNETGVPCLDATDDWWADSTGTMLRNRDAHDLYLFAHGHDYQAALADLTAAGGRIPLLPRFSSGVWFTRWYDYDASEARGLADEFASYALPLDVLILDMNWHKKNDWTGYTWDPTLFPNPGDTLSQLHARGLRVGANLHDADGIGTFEDTHAAVAARMGGEPGGGPFANKTIPFDLVNKTYVFALEDLAVGAREAEGMDFWWIDWQQGETQGRTGQDGRPDLKMNPTIWTAKARVTDHDRRCRSGVSACTNKRGVTFARWGGLGQHRYQHGFSGDVHGLTWATMAYQSYFSATAANVGFGFWSHDLVGPGGDPELYVRWLQLASYSSIFRMHDRGGSANAGCIGWPSKAGSCSTVRPWVIAPAFFAAAREAVRTRAKLLPYLYTQSRVAFDSGVSVVRPMYYDWPEVDGAYPATMDAMLGQLPSTRQYLFGDAMLIAPVTAPGACPPPRGTAPLDEPCGLAAHDVWLPPSTQWYALATGQLLNGTGALLSTRVHLRDTPVFAKAGSVVGRRPLGEGGALIGGATRAYEGLEWTIHPGGAAATGSGRVYEDDGETLDYLKGAFADTTLAYAWAATAYGSPIGGSPSPIGGSPSPMGGSATLTVNISTAVNKPFAGLPAQRAHTIVLPLLPPPAAVKANGVALPFARVRRGQGGAVESTKGSWSYDGAALAIVIDAPPVSTGGAPLVVTVEMGSAAASSAASSAACDVRVSQPPGEMSRALSGVPALIVNAARAKANLDEARATPGAHVPDTAYGKPLNRMAEASDALGYSAGQRCAQAAFDAKVAEVRTAYGQAVKELNGILAKAKGDAAARLQYSLDILTSVPA
jgi:alpha-glucosidase (family GH31 glycosyl hydrolase)